MACWDAPDGCSALANPTPMATYPDGGAIPSQLLRLALARSNAALYLLVAASYFAEEVAWFRCGDSVDGGHGVCLLET